MTGILFDLDGTLLDTLEDLRDATNHVLRQYGYPERSLDQIRRAVGNAAANQIRKSLPEGTDEAVVQELLPVYKAYYTDHCQIRTKPYAGVEEALAVLKERYPVAIVSNKPDAAVKELCAYYFPGTYALGEAADCPRKPAPDMVFKGMKAIGADRCVYVGDSEVDILTAKNAGVPCVCVLWGFRRREELGEAENVVFCEDTANLIECIEELIHGQ